MSRSSGMTVMRGAGALLASTLLAVGAALGAAPSGAAGATRTTLAGPAPASPQTVLQELGVAAVPAELVFLVDTSDSMSPGQNNLYPTVRQKVLAFLGVLAKQDPQDLVGIILFGNPPDNQIFDPGSPDPNFYLPTVPSYSVGTDFGYAFQQAVDMLSQAPQNIKVGGVLLLSDGEPYAPNDPTYGGNGFTAPGWKALRIRVQNLPMTVTGYDVPLTKNTSYTANQHAALSQVFSNVQTLPSGLTDLGGAFDQAKQKILDDKVASAAAPDNGQGVRVAWSGLPGTGGKPLDLSAGHANVTVTVTAATHRVPLYLSGLSVTSAGLPVTMTGDPPVGQALGPGQSATWHVQLTWPPGASGATLTGGARTLRGHLVLNAQVSSPFTPTLRSAYSDTAFSVGGLSGGTSAQFTATAPAAWKIAELLLFLLLVLVLLACAVAIRARMSGTLVLTSVDEVSGEVPLRGPWLATRTHKLIEIPGRLTVHGSPVHPRRMRIGLRLDGRPPSDETLLPGGRTMAAGIDIVHYPRAGRVRSAARNRRR
jgi:hypothetical protein